MNDYKTKSKKYSGGIKALLSDWMILFLFIALFALCCLNSNFRTTTNIDSRNLPLLEDKMQSMEQLFDHFTKSLEVV